MSDSDLDIEFPEDELFCAACAERHNEDDVRVKVENQNSEEQALFYCPRTMEITHYGPWGYAIDSDGVEYTYNDEGELVRCNVGYFERLLKLLKLK